MRKLMLLCLTHTLLLATSAAYTVTLDVVGGQLLGAFDVDVDGSLYDVAFVDGSCISLYSGCDEVSDFTFQTEASALLAAQALLDQVFVGVFDSDSSLTNGCDATNCVAHTPYSTDGVSVSLSSANNQDVIADSVSSGGTGPIGFDFSGSPASVLAVWSPVPEPTTGLLLAGGLFALSAFRRQLTPR